MKTWIFGVAALAAAVCFGATTEDGVTKERRGALGPNDTVVTDVDTTGIVAARTYTKDEIDRRIATNAPVRSVNGRTGRVILGASDVGALPNNRDGLKANANFRNAVWDVQIRGGGIDTSTVDALANSAVVTNALTVATTNRVASHVANTNNPHAVTAAQVGAIPLVEDRYGKKTAVTIGGRVRGQPVGEYSLANGILTTASGDRSHAEGSVTTASGHYSHAEGAGTTASGSSSHAEGADTTASGFFSHAEGSSTTASGDYSHAAGYRAQTRRVDDYSFAWNGDSARSDQYSSHGPGTYNINPAGGLDGFWIGEQTLASILTNKADKADISAENPTFSNDVLNIVRDEIIPATNSLYTTLNGSIDVKRGKADLAVYEVVRAENTNWTLVGNDGITTQCTSEWTGFGFAFYKDGVNVAASDTTVSRDAKTTTWAGSPKIGYSGVATRTSYMDESIVQNPDQHLASVTTNGAGKVAEGDMVKLGANARLVKADAGTDYQDALPYPTNAIPWDVIANPPDIPVIDATDPTFSDAVLAVGLNIDTNAVAVLNDIAATFGGFPIEGTATTVGGLLAALAAAVAWLKKNKVGSFASVGGATATVENGVAKLGDFFTNSNSLLTVTIDARLPYPLNAVADETGLLKDRAINTTSLASVTVPENFTDLLVRASVASSLAVTMPEAIATKYGDTFPGEAGEYLITITKTGAAEAYVRTIKLEEVA